MVQPRQRLLYRKHKSDTFAIKGAVVALRGQDFFAYTCAHSHRNGSAPLFAQRDELKDSGLSSFSLASVGQTFLCPCNFDVPLILKECVIARWSLFMYECTSGHPLDPFADAGMR